MKMLLIIALAIISFAAIAQDVPAPTIGEVQDLLKSIGGLKGASALAIAVVVVQALLLLVRSSFVKLKGSIKLLIVTGLTLVSGVLALVVSGLPVSAALLHASTIAAFQVFAHQVLKQFLEKKA